MSLPRPHRARCVELFSGSCVAVAQGRLGCEYELIRPISTPVIGTYSVQRIMFVCRIGT